VILAAMLLLAAIFIVATRNESLGQGSGVAVWDPNEYERTKDLTGAGLFDALTKTTFRAGPGDTILMTDSPVTLNGEPVVGCPPEGAPMAQLLPIGPSSAAEDGPGEVACVGIANQEQATDIAQRYSGADVTSD
jgi:hypothetical protein